MPRCGRWYTATAVGIRIARPSTQSDQPSISATASTTIADDEQARRRDQAVA